jgi:hypothetical protein
VSKASWKRVSNVRDFLSAKGNIRTGTHNMSKKTLHWPYCANCGLILLKNEATRKAYKAPCVWEDD